MATIQDVAKHAKVGAATVSRVLNGSGYVKDATREKVMKAIRDLDYIPNEVARNLYHRKTNIVAIIVPEVAHPFFAEFLNSCEIALCEQGYECMICNTSTEHNSESHYLEILKQQRVDGIITGVHSLEISQYQETDRPIVALDRNLDNKIPCVAVNHEKGGRMAAMELIAAGCKNVLQCTGSTGIDKVTTPSNIRHEVFARTMEENGILCHNYISQWNRFSPSYYHFAAEDIIKKYPEVDGFFATDMMAIALIKAAQRHGKNYPKDFKVVAYDGTYLSDMIYPSITTIVQPIKELAQTCVHLLVELIQGRELKERSIQLDVELRKGDSTKIT